MEVGNTKKFYCVKCNKENTLNLNKFYAKESKLILIISGLIFLFGTAVGIYFVMKMISEMKTVIGIFIIATGLIIPVWIYGILNSEDLKRVRAFNQTYVSE